MFLAAAYAPVLPMYTDPELYSTRILPEQYQPAVDGVETALHAPDFVDPRNHNSLCAYGRRLLPPRQIPRWENSPQIVVSHLLWRRGCPLR